MLVSDHTGRVLLHVLMLMIVNNGDGILLAAFSLGSGCFFWLIRNLDEVALLLIVLLFVRCGLGRDRGVVHRRAVVRIAVEWGCE